VVYTLGTYTNEISMIVKNAAGLIVFQRNSGAKFFVNTLLGTFCVECYNPITAAIRSSL